MYRGFVYVHVYAPMCMSGAHKGQKATDPLGLSLQTAMSNLVSTEN